MAIVYVREFWEGAKGTFDDYGHQTYVRTFRVKTTSADDGPLVVGAAVDPVTAVAIPALFSVYADANGNTDPYSYACQILPTQDQADPLRWVVMVEYSSETYDPTKANRNPLLRAPVFRGSPVKIRKVRYKDKGGHPVVNSANQGFLNLPEVDYSQHALTIVRNEAFVDIPTLVDLQATYENHLNDALFYAQGIGEVKCDEISWELRYDSVPYYVAITYNFLVDSEGWNQVLLDQGFSHLDPNGVLTPNYDPITNQPFADQKLLDGHGHLWLGSPFSTTLTLPVSPGTATFTLATPLPFPANQNDLNQLIGVDGQYMLFDPGGANEESVRVTSLGGGAYNGVFTKIHALNVKVQGGQPVFLSFTVYESADFGALSFPGA